MEGEPGHGGSGIQDRAQELMLSEDVIVVLAVGLSIKLNGKWTAFI